MMRSFRPFAVAACLSAAFVCHPGEAQAAKKYKASLEVPAPGLADLSLKEKSVKIQVRKIKDVPTPVAVVRGSFTRKDWSLTWTNGTRLQKIANPENFEFAFKLTGPVTTFPLTAIGPMGEVEATRLVVSFTEWEEATSLKKVNTTPSRHIFSPAMGVTTFSYSQTDVPDFSQLAMTAKVGYDFIFSPIWSFGASGYYTALPISSNREGVNARYLGLNLRASRAFALLPEPWSFRLGFGAYYASMVATNQVFGYTNQAGPQVFPSVSRKINARQTVGGYLKFAALMNSFVPQSPLESRELAAGVNWSYKLSNGHAISTSLDIAQLNAVSADRELSSSTITLGAGYTF